MTRFHIAALMIVTLCSSAAPVAAQSPWPKTPPSWPGAPRRPGLPSLPARATSLDDVPRQVVSATPGSFLTLSPNVEYELRTIPRLAIGVSTSRSLWTLGHLSTHRELLARFYPEGLAFNGFGVGIRAGESRISGVGRSRSIGVEGLFTTTPSKHAYLSMSFGARHIEGAPESIFGTFHPMVRASVGIGF